MSSIYHQPYRKLVYKKVYKQVYKQTIMYYNLTISTEGGDVVKHLRVAADVEIIQELLGLSVAELAQQLGVTHQSIYNWKTNEEQVTAKNLEKIYDFAYSKNIRLNKIKEQPGTRFFSTAPRHTLMVRFLWKKPRTETTSAEDSTVEKVWSSRQCLFQTSLRPLCTSLTLIQPA